MKQRMTGLHKTALAALFTVGNSLIRFPWRNADPDMLWLFLLSAVGALIPAFLLYPLFRKLLRAKLGGHPGKMTVAVVLSVLLGGYALWCAWRGCADYVGLLSDMILPGEGRLLPAFLFLLCAVWLAHISEKGVDSFCLLAFVGAILCVLMLFAFGAPHYRGEYFQIGGIGDAAGLVGALPSLWWESLLPLTVLAGYFALVVPKKGERALAVGTAVGCGVLLLCVLQVLLTFGAAYAASLPYPYSFAVRIISVGQYFFRLEGFSYVLDYAACLVRSAICLATARRLLGRFFPRIGRFLPPVAGIVMFGIFCLV